MAARPYDRLKCHCVFADSAARLEAALSQLETLVSEKTSVKKALNKAEVTLALLTQNYQDHIVLHNRTLSQSMIHFAKRQAISANHLTPLQTTAWASGTVDERRIPVKKKRNKKMAKGRKKASVSAKSVGVETSAPASKRQKNEKKKIKKEKY